MVYTSLYNSTDSKLLLEFYFLVENVLQESADKKSHSLITFKTLEIEKNLDERKGKIVT